MGTPEAWGIVGGGPPDANDTRFDCVGAFTKSINGDHDNFGSCVLVAPNVILTVRHNFNSCGSLPNGCPCYDQWIEPGASFVARFRRLPSGGVGTPFTEQYEVPIVQWFYAASTTWPECNDLDFAVAILAWNLTHIEPAVVDYSDIHDPPDRNPLESLNSYGEYWIAGWGRDSSFQLPGTVQFAPMIGRCARFGPASSASFADSGGGVFAEGSCDRMRLVGLITIPSAAVPCWRLPPELRALIPAPPSCVRELTADLMPDPHVIGRVTATAFIRDPAMIIDQTFNAIPSSGWHPCDGGMGRCAEGISRGTSAGVSGTSSDPNECWFTASAGCSGTGGFSLSVKEELLLEFNVNSTHSTSTQRLAGGGPDPLNLDADAALGCPTNSEPFQIEIPFEVLGTKTSMLRVQASGRVLVTWGAAVPTAPPWRPDALNDSRTSWDLFSDADLNGRVSPLDELMGSAQGDVLQTIVQLPVPFGIRLKSLEVAPGRYVLRVKHEIDASIRASVKACEPEARAGTPTVDAELVVRVVVDRY